MILTITDRCSKMPILVEVVIVTPNAEMTYEMVTGTWSDEDEGLAAGADAAAVAAAGNG